MTLLFGSVSNIGQPRHFDFWIFLFFTSCATGSPQPSFCQLWVHGVEEHYLAEDKCWKAGRWMEDGEKHSEEKWSGFCIVASHSSPSSRCAFAPMLKRRLKNIEGKTDVSSKDSPLYDATEGGKAAAHACQCHRNVQGSDVDQKTVQPDLLIELVTALRRRHDDKIPTHLSPHFRLTVTHLNGVYKQRAIKNIITVTVCNEDVKSKKGSKSYLTEFALLPSAFMNTFTWSNGACTYIFNLKHKFGQKTDTHAVTTKVWTEIV